MDFLKESLGEGQGRTRFDGLGSHAVTMVPDGGMSFEMEKYMHTVDPSSDYHCGRILRSTRSIRCCSVCPRTGNPIRSAPKSWQSFSTIRAC